MRCGIATIVLLITLALPGCLPLAGETPPPFDVSANGKAETVVLGANAPTALAFAPDGRIFYTEKSTGLVRVVSGGVLLDQPFASLPVNNAGVRGALGIALHPDFETNQRIYIFYSRSDTGETTSDSQAIVDQRVVYFEADGDVADGGEIFVASLPVGESVGPIGGRLAFGPDGKLYVALGDLGDPGAAQDDDNLEGKLLRYNDDGTIPSDNPVGGSPIFARGIRNGLGLTFDALSGQAWIVDQNAGGHHEVNRSVSGTNLGWPEVAGVAKTAAQLAFVDQTPGYLDPIVESGLDAPGFVGGGFNPSDRYGVSQRQRFFLGESGTRVVRRLTLSDDRNAVVQSSVFAENFPSAITDVAFTPAGTLYVACEDAIYRVAPVR
ncbi:MAG: Aldose sugar dehydrogenase YliI [Phycisphaerae bacterium]|nr:Aldose sugar dehydrogenase YliI [Phycisphaerae bacterium]